MNGIKIKSPVVFVDKHMIGENVRLTIKPATTVRNPIIFHKCVNKEFGSKTIDPLLITLLSKYNWMINQKNYK